MPVNTGFSAVELLIVAGIISILVAIAVPNFLEAKVRAEVMDVQLTLNKCHNALVQYQVSYNHLPEVQASSTASLAPLILAGMLDEAPADRFKNGLTGKEYGPLYADPFVDYDNLDNPQKVFAKMLRRGSSSFPAVSSTGKNSFVLKSIGPDQIDFQDEGLGRGTHQPNPAGLTAYDASNGVFSLGDIVKLSPNN